MDSSIASAATTSTLVRIVEALCEQTPNTQYQLPEGFYRADLLSSLVPAFERQTLPEEEEVLDLRTQANHAFVPLSYEDGYPALEKTQAPFWYRLPHEDEDTYELFQHYVLLGSEGARIVDDHFHLLPARLKHRFSPEEILSIKTLYYWVPRAKAYDAFDTMVRRRQRTAYSSQAEDRHYHVSELLLRKAVAFVQSDSFLDGMNTKTALEAVKLAVALQRQSLGLQPNTGGESKAPTIDMQFELHRTMNPQAEDSEFHGNRNDASELIMLPDGTKVPRGVSSSATKIREVLRDPETLRIAESLVIKMGSTQTH